MEDGDNQHQLLIGVKKITWLLTMLQNFVSSLISTVNYYVLELCKSIV